MIGYPLTCADCPLQYGDPGWCDAVVPDDVWSKIAPRPDGGGVLCITCMARRLLNLGLDHVPLTITSGPFVVTDYRYENLRHNYRAVVAMLPDGSEARS